MLAAPGDSVTATAITHTLHNQRPNYMFNDEGAALDDPDECAMQRTWLKLQIVPGGHHPRRRSCEVHHYVPVFTVSVDFAPCTVLHTIVMCCVLLSCVMELIHCMHA